MTNIEKLRRELIGRTVTGIEQASDCPSMPEVTLDDGTAVDIYPDDVDFDGNRVGETLKVLIAGHQLLFPTDPREWHDEAAEQPAEVADA